MQNRYYILLGIFATLLAGFAAPVFAREDYFKPALGEVSAAAPGLERAVTLNSGGLMLYKENGKAVKGFPILVAGRVVASSPVIADVTGDGQKEIIFITRNSAGNFLLQASTGAGVLLGTGAITGSVYYDPQELRVPGATARDILLTTLSGNVISYHFQNGAFVPTTLLALGSAAAATPDSTGKELAIIYPETKQLTIYSKVGSAWTFKRTITLASAILFPATRAATGTVVYGVTVNNNLVAYDSATGLVISGFPVVLPRAPIDSPIIMDIDSAQTGAELIVPVSGGNSVVVSAAGIILNKKFATKSFLGKGIGAADSAHNGLYSAVRDYASLIVQKNTKKLVSPFGLGQFNVVTVGSVGQISVSVSGTAVGNGGGYNFTPTNMGSSTITTFTITNNGVSALQLTGTSPVAIAGDALQEFTIVNNPTSIIAPGTSTNFTLRFTPISAGTKNIELHLANNDPEESDFVVTVSASSPVNGVNIADAEDNLPNRFTLLYPSPAVTASVKIVADDALHGNTYEYKVSNGSWFLSVSPDATVPTWDIAANPIFQWEVATTNTATFLLTVNTSQGWKYLYYHIQNTPVTGRTVYSPDHQDGLWHTYSVNIAQDIAARYPGAIPNSIVSFRLTGNGRLDNLRLLKNANLATVSGTAVDELGAPVPSATLTLLPLGRTVVTDVVGKFTLPSLPAGTYSVNAVKPFFAPVSLDTITINPGDTSVVATIHFTSLSSLTIANAANNDAARFTLLYPSTAVTSSMQTVSDPVQGQAYDYSVSSGNWFYSIAQDSAVPNWDISNNRATLAWESKIGADNNFLITVQTDQGSRYLYYSTGHTPHVVSNAGYFQLPANFADGQWHTISRNLKTDLATYFPEVTTIKWIISYRLTGHGRLNNLRLLKSTP